jgi:hypothetical protein
VRDVALDGGQVDPGQRPHPAHASARVSASRTSTISRTVRAIPGSGV